MEMFIAGIHGHPGTLPLFPGSCAQELG